jgi:hypothetical protein
MSDREKVDVMERGSSIRATASIPKVRNTATLVHPSTVWMRIMSIGYRLSTIKISDGRNRYVARALNLFSKDSMWKTKNVKTESV